MRIERIKWVIIAALFFVDVLVFYAGYRIGENSNVHALQDLNQAISECTEDLLGKCGQLYEYTVMIEGENSRLNRLYNGCENNASR